MNNRRTVLAILLGAASGTLPAGTPPTAATKPHEAYLLKSEGDPEPPSVFGVQVYWARPQFDLRTMTPHTGQGLGLFMEDRLTPTSVLQTRIDFVNFRQADFSSPDPSPLLSPGVTSLSANAASIGADYRQYLPFPHLETVYVLGGMSASRYEFITLATPAPTRDSNGNPLPAVPVQGKEKTSMKWGLAFGLGWEFRPGFALTARCTYVPISSTNLGALELGVRASF